MWIGLPEYVQEDGTVTYSYPTAYANTLRDQWGENAMTTSDFAFGASQVGCASLGDLSSQSTAVHERLLRQPCAGGRLSLPDNHGVQQRRLQCGRGAVQRLLHLCEPDRRQDLCWHRDTPLDAAHGCTGRRAAQPVPQPIAPRQLCDHN